MKFLKRLYDWLSQQMHAPYATTLLAILFFIEAIFFVPVDPLLVLCCLERRSEAYFLATVVTIASVLGGLASYYLGFALWETVGHTCVNMVTTPDRFDYLREQYELYESWAVLVAGFTPIPYKAVTLTAGFCRLPLMPFIICSFIARGARFYLVAFVIRTWGVHIKKYVDQWFFSLVFLFMGIVLVGLWALR